MSKLPNHNPNCNNTLEWAVDIEKQVEDKIVEISLNIDNIAKKHANRHIGSFTATN